MKSLSHKVFFSFLSWLLPLVSTFIVTPFVVRKLGTEEFGLYTLIIGFISYSFTFSIGRAVTKYVAEYIAIGETSSLSDVLSATFALNLLFGVGGGGIICALAPVFVVRVLQVETHLQARAVSAFQLAAITIFLFMMQQVFSSVLQAIGRFDWFSYLTTIISTALSLGNLLLVLSGGEVLTLLWWNLLCTAVGTAIFFVAARRLLPAANLRFRFSQSVFRRVATFSAGVIAYQISGNFLVLFERSWVIKQFGAQNLTFYALPMTLAIYVQTFVTSFILVLMPLMSELGAVADKAQLRFVYERATKYTALLIAFVGTPLIVGNRIFLELWLDKEFALRCNLIMIFHLVSFGSIALGAIAWLTSEGLGFPLRNALIGFLWAVLAVPLMLGLAPIFELEGIAAGRMSAVVLTLPFFILFVERQTFGKVLWRFWRKTILSLVFAGAVSGVALSIWLQNTIVNWSNFLIVNAICSLIFLITLFFTKFFSDDERDRMNQLFVRHLKSL